MNIKKQLVATLFLYSALALPHAEAAIVPSSADIAHTTTILDTKPALAPIKASSFQTPKINNHAPEGSAQIDITIESIKVNGVTAFSRQDIEKEYQEYLHKKTKLSTLWDIADRITTLYTKHGYFLSRAFVPEQDIENGHLIINVVEGYIGDIKLDPSLENNDIIQNIKQELATKKPILIRDLERIALQANDASGKEVHATLYALESAQDGAVGLQFSPSTIQKARGSWIVNNYGSRYTGPYQNTLVYQDNFYKNHTTQFALQHTIPTDESKYINICHTIPIAEATSFSLAASYIVSRPGYTLKPQQIHSNAFDISGELRYNIIRQQNENLSITAGIEHKVVDTNLLKNTDFSHDSLYHMTLGIEGDFLDNLGGRNAAAFTFTRGIKIFDANEKYSLNSSRSGAQPEFNKFELDLQRQQFITDNLALNLQAKGQYSTDTLYSSEEFGFGGQSIGRAYDASEFSSQRGIEGSAEMYYYGFTSLKLAVTPVPFVFYDFATLSNPNDTNKHIQASSAGIGTKLDFNTHASSSITVAFPLQEDIGTPTYGSNRAPRFLIQFNYNFN